MSSKTGKWLVNDPVRRRGFWRQVRNHHLGRLSLKRRKFWLLIFNSIQCNKDTLGSRFVRVIFAAVLTSIEICIKKLKLWSKLKYLKFNFILLNKSQNLQKNGQKRNTLTFAFLTHIRMCSILWAIFYHPAFIYYQRAGAFVRIDAVF